MAPDGSVLVQASTYVLWENSTGTYLPVNLQPTRFQIDAPTLVTTPLRFEADWSLSYYTNKVKTQSLGSLVLIVDFQKSTFPKQSVHLQLDTYQIDLECVGKDCARETYWNNVRLGGRYWSWLQAPADKTVLANGPENLKVSANTWNTATTSESKQETLTPLATAKPLALSEKIQFTSSVNWYSDWKGAMVQQTTLETSLSSKNLLSLPIVSTSFAVNMDYVDPAFGLTSTGSTSYPTAKAITANGNAQIDTAQSVFGGASGLFDGNGDYLSTPDSIDWALGVTWTIDLRFRLAALPAAWGYYDVVTQYVDTNNKWDLAISDETGDGKPEIFFGLKSGGTWLIYDVWTPSPALAKDTWYHLALSSVSLVDGYIYCFQDGSRLTKTAGFSESTDTIPDMASLLYIGVKGDISGSFLNGWSDELRISKGIARWTSNFTPPTARYDRDGCVSGGSCASPDSYTVLLLHNDGADTSPTFLDDVTTGLAKATSASSTAISTATSVSFYSHAAGNVRLAIYSDVLGVPTALLWESGDTSVTATAWTTVNISAGTPSTLALAVATYWLAWQWNPGAAYAAGPSYTAGSANTGDYIYQAYGAFPATWTGGTLSAENWSIYVTYSTIVAYTRTATAQMTQSAVNARTEQVLKTNTAQMTEAPTLLRIENLPRASSQALSTVITLPIIVHYGKAISATITNSISDSRILSLPKTLTQSITNSLSASPILGLLVSASETITASASNSRISNLIRGIGQSLTSGFSLLIVSTLTRLVSQGIAPSITASRVIGLFTTTTETITASVSNLRNLSILATISQAFSVTVSNSRLLTLLREVSVSILLSAINSKTFSATSIINQGITQSVSLSNIIGLFVSASQSITIGISTVRTTALSEALSQTFASVPLLSRLNSLLSAATVAITSSIDAYRLSSLARVATESSTVIGVPAIIIGLFKTVTEGMTNSALTARTLSLFTTASDTMLTTVSVLSNALLGRTVSVSIIAVPSVSRLASLLSSASVAVSSSILDSRIMSLNTVSSMVILFVDLVFDQANLLRTVTASIVLSSNTLTLLSLERAVSDTIAFSIGATGIFQVARIMSTALSASPVLNLGTLGLVRSVTEGFTNNISVTALIGLFKTASETITASVVVVGNALLGRSVSASITNTPTLARGSMTLLKNLIATITSTLSTATLLALLKTVTLGFTQTVIGERLVSFPKILSETIISTITVFGNVLFGRTASVSIATVPSVSRLIGLFKSASVGIVDSVVLVRALSFTRTIIQGITQTLTVVGIQMIKVLTLAITVAPSNLQTTGFIRAITGSIAEAVSVSRILSLLNTISLALTLNIAVLSGIKEIILQGITNTITLSRTATFPDVANQLFSISISNSIILEFFKTASQQIVTTITTSRLIHLIQNPTATITLSASVARIISTIKIVATSIVNTVSGDRLLHLARALSSGVSVGAVGLFYITSQNIVIPVSTIVYYSSVPYYAIPGIMIGLVALIFAVRRRTKREETV